MTNWIQAEEQANNLLELRNKHNHISIDDDGNWCQTYQCYFGERLLPGFAGAKSHRFYRVRFVRDHLQDTHSHKFDKLAIKAGLSG